jgi:hypothetical protein
VELAVNPIWMSRLNKAVGENDPQYRAVDCGEIAMCVVMNLEIQNESEVEIFGG